MFPRVTTTCAVPTGRPQGTCALIWSPLMASWKTPEMGAVMPLKVTLSPPREVGSGIELAKELLVAKLVPKIETSDPAAAAWPGEKLAEFKTARAGSTVGTVDSVQGLIAEWLL